MEPSYSIRAVAEETGLSAHTIRAWERRYGVPTPLRTESNRRRYAPEDVRRLKLLQRAVAAGHSIGMIAGLSTEDLRRLAGAETAPALRRHAPDGLVEECVAAMLDLDAQRLESLLVRAASMLGIDALLSDVVVPLLHELDRGWEDKTVRIAHEHMASAVLRVQLERIRLSLPVVSSAPRLVVTTPSGQLHELGALLAAISAARDGWHVTYLGPNLPAQEIAMAADRIGARVVALSLVYPEADPLAAAELRLLRRELAPGVQILVGGRAATSYADVLDEIGARKVGTMGAIGTARSMRWSDER